MWLILLVSLEPLALSAPVEASRLSERVRFPVERPMLVASTGPDGVLPLAESRGPVRGPFSARRLSLTGSTAAGSIFPCPLGILCCAAGFWAARKPLADVMRLCNLVPFTQPSPSSSEDEGDMARDRARLLPKPFGLGAADVVRERARVVGCREASCGVGRTSSKRTRNDLPPGGGFIGVASRNVSSAAPSAWLGRVSSSSLSRSVVGKLSAR